MFNFPLFDANKDMISGLGGCLINVQIYSTPGVYSYTPSNEFVTGVMFEVWGGGGGGAGAQANSSTAAAGSGGGAGGHSKVYFPNYKQLISDGSTTDIELTVGAGGAGGVGNLEGANGNPSIILLVRPSGNLSVANSRGGAGGQEMTASTTATSGAEGAGGGVGTLSLGASLMTLHVQSGSGSEGNRLSATAAHPGQGGDAQWGGAGGASVPEETNGNPGIFPGGGGSSAASTSVATSYNGGNGANGCIIAWEYA